MQITEGFKILSFMFTGLTINSVELLNGFHRLASNQEITRAERSKLKSEMMKYCERINDQPFFIGLLTDMLMALPYFNIKRLKFDEKKQSSSLEQFMDAIINRVSDYKCFVNVFELLRLKRKKHYLPHKSTPYDVFQFVSTNILNAHRDILSFRLFSGEFTKEQFENKLKLFDRNIIDDKRCTFVINTYQYCLESIIALHDDKIKCEKMKLNNYEEVSDINYCILAVFHYIYNTTIRDRFLSDLLFEMIPVLVTKRNPETDWKRENYSTLFRNLCAIMIELNKYGFKVCTSEKYENFFFNNTSYDTIGNHPQKKEEIISQMTQLIIVSFNGSNMTQPTLPQHNYLFEKIKWSHYKRYFNKNIRLYWRGELKTIYQIYENVEFDILNPSYVYALYDIYFKFLMATLYYDFRIAVENIQWNYAFLKLSQLADLNEFTDNLRKLRDPLPETILPPTFTKNYNLCLKNFLNKMCTNIIFTHPIDMKNLENTIRESGIVIDLVLPRRQVAYSNMDELSADDMLQKKKKVIESINDYVRDRKNILEAINEADAELKSFKLFYSKLIRFNM